MKNYWLETRQDRIDEAELDAVLAMLDTQPEAVSDPIDPIDADADAVMYALVQEYKRYSQSSPHTRRDVILEGARHYYTVPGTHPDRHVFSS